MGPLIQPDLRREPEIHLSFESVRFRHLHP
jgi:hypothetical protein